MAPSENLPADMMFEILTRITPLKTLDTCKTVCKEWDQITKEPAFLPNYCEKTSNFSGYFVQCLNHSKYVSQFVSIDQANKGGASRSWSNLPNDIRILASCDQGILCCFKEEYKKSRYYACKPATKQWRTLPNPKLRYRTEAVAIMVMDSNHEYLHYKIVRLSHRDYQGANTHFVVEVFDSRLWSWSEKDDLILPYGEHLSFCPPVEVRGSLYYLTNCNNVLVFHPDSNSFDKLSFDEKNDKYRHTLLLKYQGKLGYTTVTHEGKGVLWVLDDPQHSLWVKKMSFNLVKRISEYSFDCFRGFYNEKIAFLNLGREVVFHNLQHNDYGVAELDYMFHNVDQAFAFRSDVEPANLGPKVEETSKAQKSRKKLRKNNPAGDRHIWIYVLGFLLFIVYAMSFLL